LLSILALLEVPPVNGSDLAENRASSALYSDQIFSASSFTAPMHFWPFFHASKSDAFRFVTV
jgi:hypothetical protein